MEDKLADEWRRDVRSRYQEMAREYNVALYATGEELDGLLVVLMEIKAELRVYVIANNLTTAERARGVDCRVMWPSVPTSEQWQSSKGRTDGEKVYLWLYWRFGQGPISERTGKTQRKTYIGNDRDKIALAREMVRNRRTWERLGSEFQSIEYELMRTVTELGGWAGKAEQLRRRALDALGKEE